MIHYIYYEFLHKCQIPFNLLHFQGQRKTMTKQCIKHLTDAIYGICTLNLTVEKRRGNKEIFTSVDFFLPLLVHIIHNLSGCLKNQEKKKRKIVRKYCLPLASTSLEKQSVPTTMVAKQTEFNFLNSKVQWLLWYYNFFIRTTAWALLIRTYVCDNYLRITTKKTNFNIVHQEQNNFRSNCDSTYTLYDINVFH